MLTGISFALGATAAVVLGTYYIWKRTAKDTALPGPARYAVTVVVLAGAVLLPLVFILSRLSHRDIMCPIIFGAFFWLAIMVYVAFFLGLWDLGGLAYRLGAKVIRRSGRYSGKPGPNPASIRPQPHMDPAPDTTGNEPQDGSEPFKEGSAEPADPSVRPSSGQPADPGRRVFLARAAAGTAFLGAGTITLFGLQRGLSDIETPEVPVRLSRLPGALSGFRLALLSDLHLGPTLRKRFTEAVVERTNALKPDVVAIVGDLVDGPVGLLAEDVAPLRNLKARYGVYFTTGNHEYYSGVNAWLGQVRRLGIQVLGNRRVSVGDRGPGGAGFDLAGIHDRRGGWFSKSHRPDVGPIMAGRDPERELVLLAHQPAQIGQAVRAGAGLMLAGHTHGGQIFPWTLMVHLVQPYVSGLHRHTDRTQIYVTRGTGYWGPPVRFLAPAEITVLVLTA